MTKELRVRVKAVEGLAGQVRTTLRVGVNELRGSNGVGKSSLGRAIAARMGVSAVAVNIDAGAGGWGEVEIDNALMLVKPAGKKSKMEEMAPAPVAAVDRHPLATLITADGVGTPTLANDRRVKALARLYPLPVDEAALREMVGDDAEVFEAVRSWTGQELPSVAEAVRAALNKAALSAQKEVDDADAAVRNLAEEAEAVLQQVGGRSALTSSSPEDARAEVERLVGVRDKVERERSERVALETQQAEIRATDDPEPDHSAAQQELEAATERVERGHTVIADLRRQLAEAERSLEEAEREQERATGREQAARTAHAAWAARRSLLEKPVTGPTEAQVEAVRSELADARSIEAAAVKSAQYRDIIRRSEAKQGERVRLKTRMDRLRGLVKELGARVGDRLSQAGIPDTRIATGEEGAEPGRLCAVLEDGRVVDVNDRMVSSGQLVRWALKVAAGRMPAGGFLDLIPEPHAANWWAELDGKRRLELAEIFAAHGLIVDAEVPPDVPPHGVEAEEEELYILHLPSRERVTVEVSP